MDCRAVGFDVGDEFFPRLTGKHRAGSNCFADQRRALMEYTTATDGVVADFAVAHIFVARQTNRGTVSLKLC